MNKLLLIIVLISLADIAFTRRSPKHVIRHAYDISVLARSLCLHFQNACDAWAYALIRDKNMRQSILLECEDNWNGGFCFETNQNVLRCLRRCVNKCTGQQTTGTAATDQGDRIRVQRVQPTINGKKVNWQGLIDPTSPYVPETDDLSQCWTNCPCLNTLRMRGVRESHIQRIVGLFV